MTDYSTVQKALTSGSDPAMLCMTCPWDRNCLTPPSMTAGEIDKLVQEASQNDPHGSKALLTVLTFAGKDTAAQVCPVLAVRLRSAGGRKIAESVKGLMQSWADE